MTHWFNSRAPAFVIIQYQRTGLLKPHSKSFTVLPASAPVVGSEPTIMRKGGVAQGFGDMINDYVTVWLPLVAQDMSILQADFWSQPLPSDDPQFVYTVPIDTLGTSATNHRVAQQEVFTFRSQNGGVMRHFSMETPAPENTVIFPPFSGAAGAYVDYCTGDNSPFYARDNSYLSSVTSYKTKTNDVLKRKYIG